MATAVRAQFGMAESIFAAGRSHAGARRENGWRTAIPRFAATVANRRGVIYAIPMDARYFAVTALRRPFSSSSFSLSRLSSAQPIPFNSHLVRAIIEQAARHNRDNAAAPFDRRVAHVHAAEKAP